MLSGARKYGIGLILAHQEMGQIGDTNISNSILSNPYIRICFRLGDNDAKKFEQGFSFFDQADLQNLETGRAIVRIGSKSSDFNLSTFQLEPIDEDQHSEIRDAIIQNSRDTYATPRKDVEERLNKLYSKRVNIEFKPKIEVDTSIGAYTEEVNEEPMPQSSKAISNEVKAELIEQEVSSMEIRTHRYLQTVIKKLGQERNFIAHIEHSTNEGGRIDVVLEQDALKIAIEISETNRPDYEVKNIRKCLKEGCIPVIVVSKNKKHLNDIEKLSRKELSKKDIELVKFLQPDGLAPFLDDILIPPQSATEMVKGFRVETEFENEKIDSAQSIKSRIAKLLKKKR